MSDCLAHVDSDARKLPRGTRTLEDRSGRSQLTKIVPQLLDLPLYCVTHILRGPFQFAAGDREHTIISIRRVRALARMLELLEFGGINLGVMLVLGVARITDLMDLFVFAHFAVVLL